MACFREVYNVKYIIFFALIPFLFFNIVSETFALPGDMIEPGLVFKDHPFYPSNLGGFSSEVTSGTHKPLTNNRKLYWTIFFGDISYPVSQEEEFIILNDNCDYIFASFDLNSYGRTIDSTYDECFPSHEFYPPSRNNPKIIDILNKTYLDKASIVSEDLKNSKLIKQGYRYFYFKSPNERVRLNSDVLYSFYRGKKFDYLLTEFGFIISQIDGRNIKYLMKLVEQDEALLKKLKQQEKVLKFEQEKSIPYDL